MILMFFEKNILFLAKKWACSPRPTEKKFWSTYISTNSFQKFRVCTSPLIREIIISFLTLLLSRYHEKQLKCNQSVTLLIPPSKFQKGLTKDYFVCIMGIFGGQKTFLKVVFGICAKYEVNWWPWWS